jgi:type IV pilus assembly protein PilM
MAAKNCIGLDIGSSSVKVVQIRGGKRSAVLEAFGVEPVASQSIVDGTIMNQSAVVDAIRTLWDRLRLRRKDVAIAIAGHSVIIKKISVPTMSPEELEEQIPWEAEHHIPFAKDDVEIDHQVLGTSSTQGQMDLLLVAAKKEVVADYSHCAREAGLSPMVVDVAAFSLQNGFEQSYDVLPSETVALINVGAAITNLNIVTGGTSAFTRDMTIGGNVFTEEIQRQLGVSYEEAESFKTGRGGSVPPEVDKAIQQVAETMSGEFQRSLDFYLATSSNTSIARVYLAGGSARIPALQQAVQRRARVGVEVLDPFREVSLDEGKVDAAFARQNSSMAAVGVGLAMRWPGDNL